MCRELIIFCQSIKLNRVRVRNEVATLASGCHAFTNIQLALTATLFVASQERVEP